MKKTILIFIIIAAVIASGIFASISVKNNAKRYYIKNNTLRNNEHGYSFKIPGKFSLNEEFYPNNLRLENNDTVIEIYTEDFELQDKITSYIGYTNKAITENNVDYYDTKTFEADNATVLTWSRDKLSKIENDKNHYLKIDVINNSSVYTVLVKSTEKIADYKAYLKAFKTIKKRSFPKTIGAVRKPAEKNFNSETNDLYFKGFTFDGLSWGIFDSNYINNDNLKAYEKKIDHKFRYILWYTGLRTDYNSKRVRGVLEKAYKNNKIVELTLQPQLVHESGNDLFRLLNGYYDEYFDSLTNDIKEFSHPVLFRFANEMNGDWCEYSGYRMSLDTELYRKMYRYVYNYFKEKGVNNVIWIWNPNGKSFPDFSWNDADMYYPGDEYVDLFGLTMYNTGNFYDGEEWIEFKDLYSDLYEYSLKKYDMPFVITEFASARAGGNKEEWTKAMLSEIEKYENIKLAVWWDDADYTADGEVARAYFIDDSPEMIEIFREYFKD